MDHSPGWEAELSMVPGELNSSLIGFGKNG